MFRARHLHDDRLFECCIAERSGEPPDPRAADHLADCADCSSRYSELARFMDALRVEADAETDEVFTADRLRAQQLAIARRLEHVGRPARVISFPGAARTMATAATRVAPRWVAAAAAAGLFVGAGLGVSYEWQRGGFPTRTLARTQVRPASPLTTPVATRGSAPVDVAADEAFLSELEVALDRPRTQELRAFDALTPHFKEIKDVR